MKKEAFLPFFWTRKIPPPKSYESAVALTFFLELLLFSLYSSNPFCQFRISVGHLDRVFRLLQVMRCAAVITIASGLL
jgi:hypothetical protein